MNFGMAAMQKFEQLNQPVQFISVVCETTVEMQTVQPE
jgi:hypothetical protein